MKAIHACVAALLLLASPALVQNVWAQTKLTPKSTAAHVDNCAPIGRTANGELVYSMKCDNIPAPPPPQQAEVLSIAYEPHRALEWLCGAGKSWVETPTNT